MSAKNNSEDTLFWTEELSVGNERLDSQHKRMMSIFNDLHHAVRHDAVESMLGPTLVKLEKLANQHFADEETYMEEIGYPERQNHKQIHRQMKREVKEMVSHRESGEGIKPVELLNMLVDWLTRHIQEHDKHYTEWARANSAVPKTPRSAP